MRSAIFDFIPRPDAHSPDDFPLYRRHSQPARALDQLGSKVQTQTEITARFPLLLVGNDAILAIGPYLALPLFPSSVHSYIVPHPPSSVDRNGDQV